MKHLAILYTNNNVAPKAFAKVLSYFTKNIANSSLLFDTSGIIISVEPISNLSEGEISNLKNVIAPQEIINKGHLSIIEKISLVLKLFPSDYVSLHEHDVLYPEKYLTSIQSILNEVDFSFDYLAYNNIIGVNKTGYQKRIVHDYPLSTLTFPMDTLKNLLDHKRVEFASNGNWCYLEPGYGGSYGSHFRKIQFGKGTIEPVVHINMNQTKNNHHLTDHYLTYEPISSYGFTEWPGDLSMIFE